jgi:hypothetical protein
MQQVYAIDVKLPGMLRRDQDCPVYGSKLKSHDETKTRAAPFKKVVKVNDTTVAVVDSLRHA